MSAESFSFVTLVRQSSLLVKDLGLHFISNGKIFSELLLIKGVSLWEIMVVDLALYRVSELLDGRIKGRDYKKYLLLKLKKSYFFLKKILALRYLKLDKSGCESWPKNETILFLGFSWYLARDVLLPIAEEMMGNDSLIPILLVDEVPELIEKQGVFCGTHLARTHRTSKVRKWGLDFAKKSELRVLEIIKNNKGFQVSPRVAPMKLQRNISEALIKGAFYLSDTLALAKHIIEEHHPSVVVSIDCADPRTRAYMQIARKIGIPTVQIQAGPIDEGCAEWKFFQDDWVFVQGEMPKDQLISHGVPLEKIVVTGSPRYDRLCQSTKAEILALRERFGIPTSARILVLASTYSLAAFGQNAVSSLRVMKKTLFEAINTTPDVWLIVKPHPLENVQETRNLAAGFARIVFAGHDENIRQYICASDAFLSFGSTATYEALIINKPTICLRFSGWGELVSDFLATSSALCLATNAQELLRALKEVAVDGGVEMLEKNAFRRKEFIDSIISHDAEGASKKIAARLVSLAESYTNENRKIKTY
ncbi:CDP-glycerol glycerophosphotransferase family protein [Polynucleobacter sp. AM-25C3]|uniref:CDP-glycerol glycerophosphotransferase family protein n=1 Tax=Polynucleobacter sp. AM-25C3 TaxID=1855569 RepID=UPI001C0B531B|nr:CDP-glycerol glycerophosphotransferase family protein [Polynucleobacter sp. AM-25C3]MBU3601781.1 CDP-glycerol glycerophosphotransferase family protein [Polynucleobacter sp. AM-25C3]